MILRLVISFIAMYLLYRIARMILRLTIGKGSRPEMPPGKAESLEDLVEDPQCHTYLPVSQSFRATVDGKTLHFCSRSCYEAYRSKR